MGAMSYRIRLTLIFLLLFVLIVLFSPFIVAVPKLENTVPAKELASSQSLFLELTGQEVHYQHQAANSTNAEYTFVLLHGFGSNLQMWTPLIDGLSTYGEVIRWDAIGSGLSDKPVRGAWQKTGEGINPYTYQGQERLLEHFLEQLAIEDKLILVGHASGATLAVQYALQHRDEVQGLVLISPAVYAQGGAPDWLRPLMLTPQLNRVGVLPMRQFAGEAGTALYEGMWAQPEKITEEARARHAITSQTENWDRAMWEWTRFARTPQFVDAQLEQLQLPSLVLAGASDIVIPQEQSAMLAQVLQGEFIRLDSCGHLSPEECPERLLEALSLWLAPLP